MSFVAPFAGITPQVRRVSAGASAGRYLSRVSRQHPWFPGPSGCYRECKAAESYCLDERTRREAQMKIGRLLLRATVGGFFVGHGTQKLLGWFGGPGLEATAQGFHQMGMRPGRRNAIAAGISETAGG